MLRTLRDLGVPTAGIEIYDGSGLSRDNRITPEALVAVLRAAATDPTLRGVIASLPGVRVHRLARPTASTGRTRRPAAWSGRRPAR